MESAPLTSLRKGAIHFLNWLLQKIKRMSQDCEGLTRPTPTIYKFQENKISQKVLVKRNISSSKIHCDIDQDKAMLKKMFVFFSLLSALDPSLLLGSPRPFLLLGDPGLLINPSRN